VDLLPLLLGGRHRRFPVKNDQGPAEGHTRREQAGKQPVKFSRMRGVILPLPAKDPRKNAGRWRSMSPAPPFAPGLGPIGAGRRRPFRSRRGAPRFGEPHGLEPQVLDLAHGLLPVARVELAFVSTPSRCIAL